MFNGRANHLPWQEAHMPGRTRRRMLRPFGGAADH